MPSTENAIYSPSPLSCDRCGRTTYWCQCAPMVEKPANTCALPTCGKPLHDTYITRQNGDKLHLSCANPNRAERDHRTEAAADRAEREIERRFP